MKNILKQVKAIIFDVDQTLIDVINMAEIYSACLAEHNINVPADDKLDKSLHEAWKKVRDNYLCIASDYQTNSNKEKEFWREYAWILCSFYQIPSDFDSFFESVYQAFAKGSTRKITPGVISFIEDAKSMNKSIAALTNNDARTINVLEELGIKNLFDHVAIASEIGWKKPSAKSFEITANFLNLSPADCLYIGNSIELDYLGAKNAGMHAFLFDIDGQAKNNSIDHFFNDFNKLRELLLR
ncbi:MAG: HAD-IA family hydrolase [Bdellovibrionales bacterium]|nr:HAD-IA family hydrolase [Bdellovibrionales bacterium]